ncbi:hypothetical protein VB714_04290 [Spirulina sp. 06S082]|nr:hypothetical protein [Spirulina sp. 06S082]
MGESRLWGAFIVAFFRKVAQWITKIILPDTTTIISKTKNLEQVLEQLKQVEGMTFFDEKTKNTKYGKISSNDIKLEELEFKSSLSAFLITNTQNDTPRCTENDPQLQ